MKKTFIAITTALAALTLIGCSSGGDTYTTVEPAPVEVEVIVVNGEETQTPTDMFAGVRAAYDENDGDMEVKVIMLDNDDIDLFNFVFIVELEDGDVFYSEPNAQKEDGRITVEDTFRFKKGGRYTISLFYYGEDDVQLTKHVFDL